MRPADDPSTTAAARGKILLLLLVLAIVPLASYRRSLSGERSAGTRGGGGGDDTLAAYNSYKLNTPLFEAVKRNDLERTRALLEEGIKVRPNKMVVYNPNCEDVKGITPMIEAALLGNYELVTLLMQYGGETLFLPFFRTSRVPRPELTKS